MRAQLRIAGVHLARELARLRIAGALNPGPTWNSQLCQDGLLYNRTRELSFAVL